MFTSNRLVTSIMLITGFAIVVLAGSARSAQTSPQNVLVTNSASQAVPVKAATSLPVNVVNTANVHAYITNGVAAPVNVNDATRGKNGYQVELTATPGVD